MPACSTASLGALATLGQGGDYGPAFCSYYRGLSQQEQERYPVDAFLACGRGTGWQESAAPGAPPANGGNGNGNGNDTAMWGFLSSLVGAVPGMIHGQPPTAPPPLVRQPAARTGAVMLPLIAVGVVVWMFAQGRRAD